MIENTIGLMEMGLVFGAALGIAVWELFSVRRSLRLKGSATESSNSAGQESLK
jgi:hypothetical protein